MKALTLIQPWATAILLHGKDLENRPWAPPRAFVGQRFALHAGKKFDNDDAWNLKEELGCDVGTCPVGMIIGTVELLGFVRIQLDGRVDSAGLTDQQVTDALRSRWRARGAPALWVLRNPIALREPIPWPGALGLWNVPPELARRIEKA